MKAELFIEGRNGGSTRRVRTEEAWKCFAYEVPMPPVTIATSKGAVRVTLEEDTGLLRVELCKWKFGDCPDAAGVDQLLYLGPIEGRS